MTRAEAKEIMRTEKACCLRNMEREAGIKDSHCDRDCGKCDLVRTDAEIIDAYNIAIEALEQAQTDIELSKHEYRPVTLDIKEVERHKPNVDIETDMETCEDCISRQAVMDVMHDMWGDSGELLEALKALPPVQPKHGEWIPVKFRPLTEEEQEEYPDYDYMADCKMPDDGEEILVTTTHEIVAGDVSYFEDGFSLDGGLD